jgi:hypothetical protein
LVPENVKNKHDCAQSSIVEEYGVPLIGHEPEKHVVAE